MIFNFAVINLKYIYMSSYVYPIGDGEFRTGYRSDNNKENDKKDKEKEKKSLPLKSKEKKDCDSVWSKPKYDESKYGNYVDSLLGKTKNTDSIPEKEPDMSLFFDGEFLTVRKDKGDVILRNTYPAISGRIGDDGKFDNSQERQKMVGEGPLPEGQYWINPQKINRIAETSLVNRAYGVVGRGLFPGGKNSWGEGRIDILPKEVVVDGVKRNGFTIHGGKNPGSAGCIDLVDNDSDFFKFVEKYRGKQDSIPLSVKYKRY